ncbi:MAG: hypothetical protein M3N24_00495, partial [Actinomycetota bacterium]|nr:hypothetical protein [Actinomycetota bacterium]
VGTALAASAMGRELRFRTPIVAVAGLGLVLALILPFPRTASPAQARMDVETLPGGQASVRIQLTPSNAASDARWFEAIAWQGGGLRLVPMMQTGEGRYVTHTSVPATGDWKTLVRLHRGSDLMAVPVYMPADPEIGAREIALADRRAPFTRDTALLMREARGGPPTVARVIYMVLGLTVALWVAFLAFAAARAGSARRHPATRLGIGDARRFSKSPSSSRPRAASPQSESR